MLMTIFVSLALTRSREREKTWQTMIGENENEDENENQIRRLFRSEVVWVILIKNSIILSWEYEMMIGNVLWLEVRNSKNALWVGVRIGSSIYPSSEVRDSDSGIWLGASCNVNARG